MPGVRADECYLAQHTPCCESYIRHMLSMWEVADVIADAVFSQRYSHMVVDEWVIFTASLSQPQQATEPTSSSAGPSQGDAPSNAAGGPLAHSNLPSWLHMGVHLCCDAPDQATCLSAVPTSAAAGMATGGKHPCTLQQHLSLISASLFPWLLSYFKHCRHAMLPLNLANFQAAPFPCSCPGHIRCGSPCSSG